MNVCFVFLCRTLNAAPNQVYYLDANDNDDTHSPFGSSGYEDNDFEKMDKFLNRTGYKTHYISDLEVATLSHLIASPDTALIIFNGHGGDGYLFASQGGQQVPLATSLIQSSLKAAETGDYNRIYRGNPDLKFVAVACWGGKCSKSFETLDIPASQKIGPTTVLETIWTPYDGMLKDDIGDYLFSPSTQAFIRSLPRLSPSHREHLGGVNAALQKKYDDDDAWQKLNDSYRSLLGKRKLWELFFGDPAEKRMTALRVLSGEGSQLEVTKLQELLPQALDRCRTADQVDHVVFSFDGRQKTERVEILLKNMDKLDKVLSLRPDTYADAITNLLFKMKHPRQIGDFLLKAWPYLEKHGLLSQFIPLVERAIPHANSSTASLVSNLIQQKTSDSVPLGKELQIRPEVIPVASSNPSKVPPGAEQTSRCRRVTPSLLTRAN